MPLRILVVDDDALSRDVLALLLEHAGYPVDTADSGDAAIRLLSTTPDRLPAVVLADIQMPGLAGSELAHAMREQCGANTMLLAMSGSTPPPEIIREFEGFLLKPFTIPKLAATIAAKGNSVQVPEFPVQANQIILDEAIYDKLAGSMRKERLDGLYALFLNDAEERIARMRESASKNGDADVRKEAHAIKGGAGMVGALELRLLAGSIEENGSHADDVASLDELVIACKRLRRILSMRGNI